MEKLSGHTDVRGQIETRLVDASAANQLIEKLRDTGHVEALFTLFAGGFLSSLIATLASDSPPKPALLAIPWVTGLLALAFGVWWILLQKRTKAARDAYKTGTSLTSTTSIGLQYGAGPSIKWSGASPTGENPEGPLAPTAETDQPDKGEETKADGYE